MVCPPLLWILLHFFFLSLSLSLIPISGSRFVRPVGSCSVSTQHNLGGGGDHPQSPPWNDATHAIHQQWGKWLAGERESKKKSLTKTCSAVWWNCSLNGKLFASSLSLEKFCRGAARARFQRFVQLRAERAATDRREFFWKTVLEIVLRCGAG